MDYTEIIFDEGVVDRDALDATEKALNLDEVGDANETDDGKYERE